jgi:hypothetical protein
VLVASSVNVETFLTCFVCYAKLDSFTIHHLVTVHVIIHHVFQLGHKCLGIYEVKVDSFVSGDLDSNVTFDEEKESLMWQTMKLLPNRKWIVFIFS